MKAPGEFSKSAVASLALTLLSACGDGTTHLPVQPQSVEIVDLLASPSAYVDTALVVQGFFNDKSPEGTFSLYVTSDDADRVAAEGYVNIATMSVNRLRDTVCEPGWSRVLGFVRYEPELTLYAYTIELLETTSGEFVPCFYTSLDLDAILNDPRVSFSGN